MDYKYKLDYEIISKKIKEARKSAALTQAELAEKVNVSTNAVAKLETNLMKISLQTLVNIANVLNIDINYLLFNQAIKEKTSQDIFLDSLISDLPPKDKDLIIHIINGLRIYK